MNAIANEVYEVRGGGNSNKLADKLRTFVDCDRCQGGPQDPWESALELSFLFNDQFCFFRILARRTRSLSGLYSLLMR